MPQEEFDVGAALLESAKDLNRLSRVAISAGKVDKAARLDEEARDRFSVFMDAQETDAQAISYMLTSLRLVEMNADTLIGSNVRALVDALVVALFEVMTRLDAATFADGLALYYEQGEDPNDRSPALTIPPDLMPPAAPEG
jgi:hypothetical protein